MGEPSVHELAECDFIARDVPDFGLSEPEYARALDHLVQANVDVIVHTADGRLLLGYRRDLPLRDMFWVFGGRMKPGETLAGTASRILARELGLEVEKDRLVLDAVYNVMWSSRSVPPEHHGFQTLLTLMRYECAEEEAASVSVADRTHEWIGWYTPDELRGLEAAGSDLLHPFLPVVLRNAGLL
ncbi:NUDIX domain-containing protein [Bailinhaonella thermotolerans]|uniref:NUDIX domain-containing protein n=1 Tax=Bailinhaonella thermotolerans TaxID=1070861 RepID=UPI00192A3D7E|nr:NUDIX hydrolase [Bailinhaonella thermotolerans]